MRGLESMLAECDGPKRAGVAGVAGERGEPGSIDLTVPDAVRLDPAVEEAKHGLAGKGLRWGWAAEGGTTGVDAVDNSSGADGEPGVDGGTGEGDGWWPATGVAASDESAITAGERYEPVSGGWTDRVGSVMVAFRGVMEMTTMLSLCRFGNGWHNDGDGDYDDEEEEEDGIAGGERGGERGGKRGREGGEGV